MIDIKERREEIESALNICTANAAAAMEEGDWHAVIEAAVDILELQSELILLEEIRCP